MSALNAVAVTVTGPLLRVRSNEAPRPRSALSGTGMDNRANSSASVSSVSGFGAKKPVAELISPLTNGGNQTPPADLSSASCGRVPPLECALLPKNYADGRHVLVR